MQFSTKIYYYILLLIVVLDIIFWHKFDNQTTMLILIISVLFPAISDEANSIREKIEHQNNLLEILLKRTNNKQDK